MTPEENALLLSAYRADPTLANRNRVVEANLGLVEKAADRFSKLSRIPFDDLFSVGCVGLIKAVERFDLSTGNRFSSYAMPRIRGEMMHYQRDREQPGGVRIPRAWVDRGKKILAGDYSGIPPEDRPLAAQAVQYRPPASLDCGGDEDDGPTIQLVAPERAGTLPTTIELLLMPLFTPPDKAEYFNATEMAQRYGKQVSHWRQSPRVVRLVKDFENRKENEKPGIISKRGRNGETWIHRDLAADFLQWLSPETRAAVCYAYSAAVADRLAS
jgi:RNA polymerase sigma factor (sigma-70 family)